jgi:putative copper export protein
MLPLIHFAHVLLGTLWLGGTLTLSLALFPALARLPADEAKQGFDRISAFAAPLLGASGGLTMLLGPLRAWLGGGITAWADFTRPYGLLVIAAFVLMTIATALGGRFRRNFLALTADPARFRAEAPALVARDAAIEAVLLVAVVAIMVVLGLGLY